MPQVAEYKELIFTIKVKPDVVEVDCRVGTDADQAEAFALCELLLGAVRDFNRLHILRDGAGEASNSMGGGIGR